MRTDYPWSELGNATVVDVGGGVGKSMTNLSPRSSVVNHEMHSAILYLYTISPQTDRASTLSHKVDSSSSCLISTPTSTLSSKTAPQS